MAALPRICLLTARGLCAAAPVPSAACVPSRITGVDRYGGPGARTTADDTIGHPHAAPLQHSR